MYTSKFYTQKSISESECNLIILKKISNMI